MAFFVDLTPQKINFKSQKLIKFISDSFNCCNIVG
jgi:hypothetical protein